MKHIIGSVAVVYFLSTIVLGISGMSVTMEIADAHGKFIDQVIVGVPFQLRVVIKGQNATGNVPIIEHPQDFVCKRSGIQMHSINGLATTVYVYTAVASVVKKYTIGPASIVLNGSQIHSSLITFEAIKGMQNSSAHSTSSGTITDLSSKPFMECVFNKSEVFLGETSFCTLRFYCPSHIQRVTLKQIKGPQIHEMQLVQKGGQKEGIELINKKPFKYIEWEFDIQFLKEGSIAVPPFSAEYTIDDEDKNMLFGGFSIFFQHNKLRQAQSNAVSITVNPVPDYKKQAVTAVGVFTDFSASITPTTIAVGDATVFSLRLTGIGNFSMIQHPPLHGVSPLVKVYESQNKIEHNSYNTEKTKVFEYIMQAIEPGLLKIPQQRFIFFDPEQKKHVEIKTTAVELHIKPVEDKPLATTTHNTTQVDDKHMHIMPSSVEESVQHVSCMDPIETMGTSTYKLPLSYTQTIMFLVLLALFVLGYYFIMMISVTVYRIIHYRCAYYSARTKIKKLEKRNNSAQLITVFKKYVASRRSLIQTDEDDLFLAIVVDVLNDQQLIANWKMFYASLMEAAYGNASELYDNHLLWRQSYYWLHLLKKRGM